MNIEQEKYYENLTGNKPEKIGALNSGERREIKHEAEIEKEERKLRIFSDAIGDEEYYIGGGIGIELIEGAIKHKHGDIDIIVFEDSINKIKEKLQSKGFIITPGHGWGGHNLDAKNYEVAEESDIPDNIDYVHIGIFIYKRDIRRGIARQILPDESAGNEFPLKYFNKDNQTLNYKENNLTVEDIRLIVSLKLISERPKDVKDIERVKPLLMSKYSQEEIEELKNICKDNLKIRNIAGLKRMFEKFLETGEEITGNNIRDNFFQTIEKEKMGEIDEEYMEAIRSFVERLNDFSVSSKEKARQEFVEFIKSHLYILTSEQNKLMDKRLE